MFLVRVVAVIAVLLTFGQACAQDGGCVGRVGDANGSGEDLPTIGDISVMIDAVFITGECIASGPHANIRCLAEADCNQSGGCNPTCEDITISDIVRLIEDAMYTCFGGNCPERAFCLVCQP